MAKEKKVCSSRLGTTGGEAVIEGVMMKSKTHTALSVRMPDGKIVTEVTKTASARDKHKWMSIPIVRGIVNFVEQMLMSYKMLERSAELSGEEENEEPSKFEKWLDRTFGKNLMNVVSGIGVFLGLALSVGLFIWLPMFLSDLFVKYVSDNLVLKSVVDGLLKVVLFVGYIALVSLMPDMRRVFQYHGAEHKSIFCYESEEELTVENVKKQKRFHPRCGTSFLFVMVFIGIIISVCYVGVEPRILRMAIKLCVLPLVVGIGYEFIRYAGRHDNLLVKILSAPGLWVQRLTTKEPDDSMIEVAIASLKASLPNVFPPEATEAPTDTDAEQPTEG